MLVFVGILILKVSDVRMTLSGFRRSIKLSTFVHSSSESLSASILACLMKSDSSWPISYTKLLTNYKGW